MAANSNLEFSPPTSLAECIQAINIMAAHLRGGPGPVDARGAQTDALIDLGGPSNRWATLWLESLGFGEGTVTFADLQNAISGSNVVLTPDMTPGGLDLRAEGLIPTGATGMIISGVSGSGGAGGGGGGGSGTLSAGSFFGHASAGGGGGGGVSVVMFQQIALTFTPDDSITAYVGNAGTGGAGRNSSGSDGTPGEITRLVVGTTQHAFPVASIGRGGTGGSSGYQGSSTTPGSGTGEDAIPSSTSYFPVAGSGGIGGVEGGQNGQNGRTSRDSSFVQANGLAGGQGGQGGTDGMAAGGRGGNGDSLLAGGAAANNNTSGEDGTDGCPGRMVIATT